MFRARLKYLFSLVVLIVMVVTVSSQAVQVSAQGAGKAAKDNIDNEFFSQPTDRIIIKYKDTAAGTMIAPASVNQSQRLSGAAGESVVYLHAMSGGAHVIKLAGKRTVADVQAIAQRLTALPEVEYAEPDRILYHTMVPNDPQYTSQWHYAAPVAGSYGINLPAAWDFTTGSASVVVGVIDTGITNHPEFTGRTVPGYDFISDPNVAVDGDNVRDADPSDPGDWSTAGLCYSGSPAEDSSWHGTHTAGTIGAASNNSVGVTGVNWNSKILPVRVLGRCGGYESDIVDGMRWAAGLSVTGVPANLNPAKVLSISLGGSGPCSATEQGAINAITAAGTTVVVAAGNSSADASNFQPASCSGVITVAATDRYGSMAWYSNFGSTVEIAAPGGDTSYAGGGVLSTLNSGTTVPASPSYAYYQGTSMATPHVAGVVSLLYSLKRELTPTKPELTPAQVLFILQGTVTHFPSSSYCNSYGCGSGIVNAGAAVSRLASSTDTETTITSDLSNPSDVGQAVTVKYTVTPASGSGTPTGTVTVTGSGGYSCSGSVAAGQCTITFNDSGSKTLVASYQGDANYLNSSSAGVPHTVNTPPTGNGYFVYLPVLLKQNPVFSGRVTDNGAAVGGQTLTLYYSTDGGTYYSTYTTATTAADGTYKFNNTPEVNASNQKFIVEWYNFDSVPTWLGFFDCNTVSNTQKDYSCDINVHDVVMVSPKPGATVRLPATFSWTARPTTSDSYWWWSYDYNKYPMGYWSSLGYRSSWVLPGLPSADFYTYQLYYWNMGVATPDGLGVGSWIRPIYYSYLNSSAASTDGVFMNSTALNAFRLHGMGQPLSDQPGFPYFVEK